MKEENLLFSIRMRDHGTRHKNYKSYKEASAMVDKLELMFPHTVFHIMVTKL